MIPPARTGLQYETVLPMRFLHLNRVRVAFGIAVLILGAAAVMSLQSISRLAANADLVSHTYEVLDRLDHLLLAVTQAESTARAFTISGDEQLRQPYQDLVRSVQSLMADLEQLTADNPRQQARIATLKPPVEEKIELQRQRFELRASQGRDAAEEQFLMGRGRQLMNQIQQVVSDMKSEEQMLLATRTAREQASARTTTIAVAVGSVLSFGILLGVYFNLEREIRRRQRSEAGLVHRNRLYAMLSQTNQAIVRVQDRKDLFDEACRVAVEYGEFEMAWVGLLEPASGRIEPVAWRGHEEGYLQDLRISAAGEPDSDPTGLALRERTYFICDNIAADIRPLPWRDEALRRGYLSTALFPIKREDQLLGSFTVFSSQAGFFDSETITLLEEVTSDLSFALQSIEQDEQRKTAEQALRNQAEILDQVHDSVVSTDLEGYVTTWNKGAHRLFGYSEAESVGRHISFVYPEDERAFLESGVIAPLKATGTHEVEVRMRRKSGEGFYAHLSLSVQRDERGTPIGMIGYSIDVTQRKEAEDEVRRLNAELEHRIAERTAQLAEANAKLAQRNEELTLASRMKSEFLRRLSHEFRTPLNSIVGFSDLLGEEGEGPLGETYADYVHHVQEGARHLLSLVNDTLDLSRIEAGRIELRYEEFPAADAVSEVLHVTKSLADAKRVDLLCDVASRLRVYADRTRFKQVLYNLVSNGLKFTSPGGAVRITADPDIGEVRLCVSDTGVGIPEADHETIFQEFHQTGPTTSGVKEGAGLGLAITKRLVELHGGLIWVESRPGEGSRFFFTMPAARASEDGSADPGTWSTSAGIGE